MRKIFALLLALAHLAFGVWLISHGVSEDTFYNRHLEEMRNYGTPVLFELRSFTYQEENENVPIRFQLEGSESPGYYPVLIDEKGHASLGERSETVPEGLYVDTQREFLYDVNAEAEHAFFSREEKRLYLSHLFSTSRFTIKGETKAVHAAAYVLDGEVLFTAVVIGGSYY